MASYHGHGLAIESLSIKDTSEVQRLQEENIQLQEEIQHLHQLLAAWQPQPCTLCQLHSSASVGTNSKAIRSRAVGSTSSKEAGSAVHAAVDRVLRQQQVVIAQQQRQLLALQVELSSREQVLLEADAVLAEADRRVAALAAWASQNAQQQPAVQTHQQRATTPGSMHASASASSRRLVSSSSLGSRPGTSLPGSSRAALSAAGSSAGGYKVDAAAGNVQQVYGVVLAHCRSLLTWCRESQARIARSKAASAAQCRGQVAATDCTSTSSAGSSRATSRAASSSGGGSKQQQWQSPDKSPPAKAEEIAQQLEVTYVPAGGNSFLPPGHSLSITGIACGHGWSALAAPAVQQLFQQLTCLAAPLAALAVQLRSVILPALPWVQCSQLGAELPSSCAQLAQQAAAAAVQLTQLCALLPATQGTLSAPAVAAAQHSRAQQAAAAADASGWGSVAAQRQQSAEQERQQSSAEAMQLDHEDQVLLQEVADLLQQSGRATSKQAHLQKTAAPAAGKHGAVSSAQAVLLRLQQRLHALCLKQGVLNDQLAFLAKCSAAQAKLMTRLATDVLQALSDALDAAEPPSVQQQRSRTLQLCAQLQRASLLAQHQQGDACASISASFRSSAQHARSSSAASSSSSISRTVLTLIESSRDILEELPRLLSLSSASALKSAATAAVVAALSDFKAGLQL